MPDRTYEIAGKRLTMHEIRLLTYIMSDPERPYCIPENVEGWEREALDMLVLSGILCRQRSLAGQWLQEWQLNSDAIEWADSIEVYSDIARANQVEFYLS